SDDRRRRPHYLHTCRDSSTESREWRKGRQVAYNPAMSEMKSPATEHEPSARDLRYSEHRIPRRHRVFVNRNLKLSKILAIRFDLDHTLAHYHPVPLEELAFDLTKRKLVESKQYPSELLDLK